jgi:hypothetical protein
VPADERCTACDAPLDPQRYARCDVCEGARFCAGCARHHLCTTRCASNGCVAGLCVHIVRDGVADARYGAAAAVA